MKERLLATIVLITITIMSCTKKNGSNNMAPFNTAADSMKISYVGGTDPYKTTRYYLIDRYFVYRDISTPVGQMPNNYSEKLSAKKYNAVKDILNAVPDELYKYPTLTAYGPTDDCTALNVTYYENGITYRWHLDNCNEQYSSAEEEFLKKLNKVVAELN